MSKQSAGILLFRIKNKRVEVFLVHPGGPFWKNKDMGAWSIPKGEFTSEENALEAAIREFKEETGVKLFGNFIALTPIKQKAGKIVNAWVVEGDLDPDAMLCETIVQIEWPPKTGRVISFPEVDKGEWFDTAEAKQKINSSQAALVDELIEKVLG
jgi:predicted NUDIX family NTP pyrophosphohydrolase